LRFSFVTLGRYVGLPEDPEQKQTEEEQEEEQEEEEAEEEEERWGNEEIMREGL
jgi:hypothetical protein